MKSPAFQFYVKQWLGDKDVLLMDWDARAMHMHFMCIAWQETPPCSVSNDDHDLRKLVGNPAGWSRLKKQIFRAWILAEGRWYQIGLLREYLKQKDFQASRKGAAMKRWHPDSIEKSTDARAMLPQCICNALQSSSSSADINPPNPPAGGFHKRPSNRRTRRLAVGANPNPSPITPASIASLRPTIEREARAAQDALVAAGKLTRDEADAKVRENVEAWEREMRGKVGRGA